jgi:hypothetical protein
MSSAVPDAAVWKWLCVLVDAWRVATCIWGEGVRKTDVGGGGMHRDIQRRAFSTWPTQLVVTLLALLALGFGALGVFGFVAGAAQPAASVLTSSAQTGDGDGSTSVVQGGDGGALVTDDDGTAQISLSAGVGDVPTSASAPSVSGVSAVPAATVAFLRVVHASPNSPPIAVIIDGAVVYSSLSYGTVAGYRQLTAASHAIVLTLATNHNHALVLIHVSLASGGSHSLMLYGLRRPRFSKDGLRFELIRDNNSFNSTSARVRVINLMVNRPAVDVYLRRVGTSTWTKRYLNIGYGGVSGYLVLTTGATQFAVANHSAAFVVSQSFLRATVSLVAATSNTVWLLGGSAQGQSGGTIGRGVRLLFTRDATRAVLNARRQ